MIKQTIKPVQQALQSLHGADERLMLITGADRITLIREAQEAQNELDEAIRAFISNFQKRTGLTVTGVQLRLEKKELWFTEVKL